MEILAELEILAEIYGLLFIIVIRDSFTITVTIIIYYYYIAFYVVQKEAKRKRKKIALPTP